MEFQVSISHGAQNDNKPTSAKETKRTSPRATRSRRYAKASVLSGVNKGMTKPRSRRLLFRTFSSCHFSAVTCKKRETKYTSSSLVRFLECLSQDSEFDKYFSAVQTYVAGRLDFCEYIFWLTPRSAVMQRLPTLRLLHTQSPRPTRDGEVRAV